MTFCLVKFMRKQHAFSLKAFGPATGPLARGFEGCLKHLEKELVEIRKDPGDVEEWADAGLLWLDGAMRAGHSPNAIVKALEDKLAINMTRTWPDWRKVPIGVPIEHDRSVPA